MQNPQICQREREKVVQGRRRLVYYALIITRLRPVGLQYRYHCFYRKCKALIMFVDIDAANETEIILQIWGIQI